MDRLPQELIEAIVSYIFSDDDGQLSSGNDGDDEDEGYAAPHKPAISTAPLAVISRAWQAAVERRTFRSIRVDSDELSHFQAAFVPARRGFLTKLVLTVILPPYDGIGRTKKETLKDKQANNKAYSDAIHSTFRILHGWEADRHADPSHRIKLFINHPVSRSDVQWHEGRPMKGPEGQIYEGRYFHSYIDLFGAEELPQLNQVSNLVMRMPKHQLGHRMVYPKVPVELASKMPNLCSIALDVNDNERRFVQRRYDQRVALAERLQALSLPSLQTADLNFFYSPPEDHHFMPPMLSPSPDHDLLSSACHAFSQGLRELTLNGVLGASLFRPLAGLKDVAWPNLQQMDIHFHQVTPQGDWYFTGEPTRQRPRGSPQLDAPEQDDDEEEFDFDREYQITGVHPSCQYRHTPDDAVISPFVEAFADAVSSMPQLRIATLHSTLLANSQDESWFVIAYIGPCTRPEVCQGKCYRLRQRNLVTDTQGWSPSDALMSKLRNMGSRFHDAELVEESMHAFLKRHGEV